MCSFDTSSGPGDLRLFSSFMILASSLNSTGQLRFSMSRNCSFLNDSTLFSTNLLNSLSKLPVSFGVNKSAKLVANASDILSGLFITSFPDFILLTLDDLIFLRLLTRCQK